MAYVTHLAIRDNTHILNSINYVKDEKKANIENITGINCDVNRAIQDFEFAKIIHEKEESKVIAHHYVQSFKPGETTEAEANEIGCKFINEIAPGYQAIVVTHLDKDHLHNHIIINSVNINTGCMYKANTESLRYVRGVSDSLCKDYNLSIIKADPYNKSIDKATYHLALKGQSWKVKMINTIDEAIMLCNTKEGFIDYLKKQGYEIKYQNKNISLKDPTEQKKFIRLNTLGRQFGKQYSIEGIEARLNGEPFKDNSINREDKLYYGNGSSEEARNVEEVEQDGNRADDFIDIRNSRNEYTYIEGNSNRTEDDNKRDKGNKRKYNIENERYDKWKAEQERSIKKGIDLEHIDNQLFKVGKALGSISSINNNKDKSKQETLKVLLTIISLIIQAKKRSKVKKAERLRRNVLKTKSSLRVGNISYEEIKVLPGENKYIKLNVDELEKLRNEATFNYTGIVKDNKITIMVKVNDLDKVLNIVGRKFEKQYGNTTYKYIKDNSKKVEYRIVDEKIIEQLRNADFKFACFKKGDKFNVSFSNKDISKYLNITKKLKERER